MLEEGRGYNGNHFSGKSRRPFKESDPPILHCAPVVVYERGGSQKLSQHDSVSFKNSDRSKITN